MESLHRSVHGASQQFKFLAKGPLRLGSSGIGWSRLAILAWLRPIASLHVVVAVLWATQKLGAYRMQHLS